VGLEMGAGRGEKEAQDPNTRQAEELGPEDLWSRGGKEDSAKNQQE
jgi:hypothetical protein